jgi:hypothetical protein
MSKKNKKKNKFSPKKTGIPVATSYHHYCLDQVVEWASVALDPEKIEKRELKRAKERKKLEEKGKLVIDID